MITEMKTYFFEDEEVYKLYTKIGFFNKKIFRNAFSAFRSAFRNGPISNTGFFHLEFLDTEVNTERAGEGGNYFISSVLAVEQLARINLLYLFL